jgi:hypothetical protein
MVAGPVAQVHDSHLEQQPDSVCDSAEKRSDEVGEQLSWEADQFIALT